jgi:hypothetical protein
MGEFAGYLDCTMSSTAVVMLVVCAVVLSGC